MSLLGAVFLSSLLLLLVLSAEAHEVTEEGIELSEVTIAAEPPVAASSQQFIPDKEILLQPQGRPAQVLRLIPGFIAVEHSTKWVEQTLDLTGIGGKAESTAPETDENADPLVKRSTTVEVNGKRFDVNMWVPETPMVVAGASPATKKKRSSASSGGSRSRLAEM